MRSQRALAAAAILFLFPSCVGFYEDWHAAKKAHPGPHENIEGAWVGSWTSGHNAHTGNLRCIVKDTGGDEYEFRYWATWAKVISGGFDIECEAATKNGTTEFSGDMDLGKLGGHFSHEGTGTPDAIKATWRSQRGDHGTFELKRPE